MLQFPASVLVGVSVTIGAPFLRTTTQRIAALAIVLTLGACAHWLFHDWLRWIGVSELLSYPALPPASNASVTNVASPYVA